MRVLLAQLDPVPADPAANAATVADVVARHPDADLAVFPELFLTGYDLTTAPGLALGPDDEPLRTVGEAARAAGTAVLVGHVERAADDGPPFNAVACFDADGSLVATYRKTHLFDREDEVFAAGEELVLCVLAGRRIAPLVCFDVEFPEPARALARDGADLLVTLSANMDPWGPDHELAARARALDNRLPHVYVNRVGDEAGLHFCGGSLAADPSGAVLEALGEEPGTSVVELDLDASPADAVDYLRRARPGLRVAATVPANTRGGSRS